MNIKSTTYKTILKQSAYLIILLGIIEIVPGLISIFYSEWYSAAGFFLSSALTAGGGYILYRVLIDADEPEFNHSLIIAAFGWLAVTMMGGLPFFIISQITPLDVMTNFIPKNATYTTSSLIYFRNPLHCFFESMSAYTTTGLTMAIHEPSVGNGILFYRSFAQWVGGAGFIIMVLAVFKRTSGRSALLLYGSEAGGEKLLPKVIDTARAIWKVYLIVTLFSAIYLFIGTLIILPDYPVVKNIFDSVNHAMAAQSTGGFSTLDDSIAEYKSPNMEMLYLLPMILGSFSITFFYKIIYERKLILIWRDIQTRALIIIFIIGSIIQSLLLLRASVVPNPIREGVFQFISGMSTTGWQTSSIGNWDWISIVFIVCTAMFVGGASGATVGGIKIIRALLIVKGLRWQINRSFLSEHTVKTISFNNKSILPEELNEDFTKAATIAILFFLFIVGSSLITTFFIGNNFTYADALFEAASAQSTVGLSTGITDPSMSPVVEIIYIFQMWAGRLEVIPVLAFFRAIFRGTSPRIL